MLKSFSIENYALIERLELNPEAGLNMITGETGAGKSILLGALSLLLGARADTSVLKYPDKACVLEGVFECGRVDLKEWLEANDLEAEQEMVVRRMILPAGKSRAFFNDMPVGLNVLKEFGDRMLDIHSQHKNLLLQTGDFQLSVLDALADTAPLLQQYRSQLSEYRNVSSDLQKLKQESQKTAADLDYIRFQFTQLEEAHLKTEEQETLESELNLLEHAEEILASLARINTAMQGEGLGALPLLRESLHEAQKLQHNYPEAASWAERIQSAYIDLNDIQTDLEKRMEQVEMDPSRLSWIQERLDLIYSLQKKHQVTTVSELLAIQANLSSRINGYDVSEWNLEQLEQKKQERYQACLKTATELSKLRHSGVKNLEKQVETHLHQLGMPHAIFRVSMHHADQFLSKGMDEIEFLFSANTGIPPKNIEGLASGGEMARLMLALKYIMVGNGNLPTILFDEIDTGVSGEVADAMGSMIERMSQQLQVINITHLPQVAAKGNAHFLVYKQDYNGVTATNIRRLNPSERIEELAKMLSGKEVTEAARRHAKELIES